MIQKRYSAQTCVKSGYIENDTHFVIKKVASGGYPMQKNTGLTYNCFRKKLEIGNVFLLDDGITHRAPHGSCRCSGGKIFGTKKRSQNRNIGFGGYKHGINSDI
jgi:hypothetical protein